MPKPRASRQALRARRRRHAAVRRTRRIAALAVLATVALATVLLTAFGSGGPRTVSVSQVAPAARLLPSGRPSPEIVALQGSLRLQLPLPQERVTVIGYHAAGEGALPLSPLGHQANEGLFSRIVHAVFGGGSSGLRYYVLGGSGGAATAALDVGAAPETDVYSPVDGTIVGITDEILSGEKHGVRIDIQPTGEPSVVVSVTRLRLDPSLTVGSSVAAATSKIGTVLDFAGVERQALARYTQDAGNHVTLQVFPAATLKLP